LAESFPCLGLSALASCLYNPAQPSTIYFSIGEAVAALALTLAVQQFFSPIYRFRLRAYGLRFFYLIIPVFLGFACAVVAALLPSLPLNRRFFLEYPIVWEAIGGLFIALSYATMAVLMLRPARVYSVNLKAFVGAAATFLTEADDSDRVRFAEDLLFPRNLTRLVEAASAWARAEHYGSMIEFERLGEIGAPPVIHGRAPISAFYLFGHRKELEAASHAGTLLRILSDPQFCSVLVRRCPWLTVSVLRYISEKRLYAEQLTPFIRQLATQAIMNEESIVAKEIGFEGFGATPYLSNSLFGDRFMLFQYDPLNDLRVGLGGELTEGYVSRLNSVAKLIVQTAIENHDLYPQGYMLSVQGAYENLFRTLSFGRYNEVSTGFLVSLQMGMSQIYKELQSAMSKIPMERLVDLYAKKEESDPWDNLAAAVAEIIYDSLESLANSFNGIDDRNWSHAISVFHDIFPSFGDQTVGLDPLQQRLAIKLVAKLRDNMKGYYPSISRVLLAVIGPYDRRDQITKAMPAGIIREAVYKELQKLKDLQVAKPDKFGDYFPPQIKYETDTDSLTFKYRSGDALVTNLGTLDLDDVCLTDPRYWRWVPIGDGMGLTL
jgi:hypothetical protein